MIRAATASGGLFDAFRGARPSGEESLRRRPQGPEAAAEAEAEALLRTRCSVSCKRFTTSIGPCSASSKLVEYPVSCAINQIRSAADYVAYYVTPLTY